MENITQQQLGLLKELWMRDPELVVEWDAIRGVASCVRGRLLEAPGANPEDAMRDFLAEFGGLFGPPELLEVVQGWRTWQDELGWWHVGYQQMHMPAWGGDALPVAGARLVGHFGPDDVLNEVQSSCWRDLKVEGQIEIEPAELRNRLAAQATGASGYRDLAARAAEAKELDFPIMQRPVAVVYPWQDRFLPAWTTYAYAPYEMEDRAGQPTGKVRLQLCELVIDARTGEQLVIAPTRMDAETAAAGTGLAVTPLGGTFTTRALNVVRVDSSNTYRLRDTTHARDIITFDVAGSTSYSDKWEIGPALANGTLPVSEDTDGDHHWSRTPSDISDAQRTAGQQPEVDGHFLARQVYEWYDALAGGRAGWDNGNYADPPVPQQPVRVLTHVYDDDASSVRSVNAYQDRALSGGKWYFYLAFFDGNPTQTCTAANDVAFDYLAGSKFILAHEYQHAITNCSFEDASGNPGLTYSGWLAAVHEGLSDVFGSLCSENWIPGPEIAPTARVFRNIAYPRDPTSWCNRTGSFPCGLNNHNKDHWDDRNLDSGFRYDRGTILAHCAYLMAQGGVHQRVSRSPALIPVQGMGRATAGTASLDVYRAARIWYRALAHYFSTHGALTGSPANDESTFRTLRSGCVSAAIDLYGNGSREHRTTVLAFYAVGLQPVDTQYGADVTFLTWGADWWISRPYLGGIHAGCPNWSSLDLFINNGGVSEWNAQINVLDGSGNPTQFENDVYCRVRNIGDQHATDVQVQFYYAKLGSAPSGWQPMTDKNGTVQMLNLGTVNAGSMSFPESQQNAPPAAAGVKWCIPPLAAGETIDHFCIKAVVSATNDANTYNNEVQSNVTYVEYSPGSRMRIAVNLGNPFKEETLPVRLEIKASLPRSWKAGIVEQVRRMKLRPGEQRTVHLELSAGEGAQRMLEPPLDGDLEGELYGNLDGRFSGSLTRTEWLNGRLSGLLAVLVNEKVGYVAQFEGELDPGAGIIWGEASGSIQDAGGESRTDVRVELKGVLRPWRRIEVGQLTDGQPIGGFTIQVQVPGPGIGPLPPTDVYVKR